MYLSSRDVTNHCFDRNFFHANILLTSVSSLCPDPNRPLDTKKVIGNTGNHLRSKPKIWIFVDFQAKSRLYAIA